jgi:hypothetical protein
MHRSMPAAVATTVAALFLAAAASAASPPASGKVDAAAPAASASQHLRNAGLTGAECPNGLACRVVPAAYEQSAAAARANVAAWLAWCGEVRRFLGPISATGVIAHEAKNRAHA